jgi:iron complex outermembrane recepter protein
LSAFRRTTGLQQIAAGLILVCWGASHANAAEELEAIIVTAQKRAQSINDVPETISAFAGADLPKLGIDKPMDLAIQTNGLLTKNSFNGASQVEFFLRGVGLSDFAATSLPAVAAYLDEVSLPSPAMLGFPFYDMERVEVLKGPQGTLYGSNSSAGAVSFFTKQPSQENSGYVTAGVSSWSTTDVQGAFGGGITDTLSGRLSGYERSSSSGYSYDTTLNRTIGAVDQKSLRGQLLWKPTDDLDAHFALYWDSDNSDMALSQLVSGRNAKNPAALCQPIMQGYRDEGPCTNPLGYYDPNPSPYVGSSDVLPHNDTDSLLTALTVDWRLSAVDLRSISSFHYFKRRQQYDVDGSPDQIGNVYENDSSKVSSEELRLTSKSKGSFNYILGAFMQRNDVEFLQNIALQQLLGFNTTNGGTQRTDSIAGYFHFDQTLTQTLSLTGGVRFTHESLQWQGGSFLGSYSSIAGLPGNLQFAGVPLLPGNLSGAAPGGPLSFSPDLTENQVDGRISLEYRPTDGVLTYAAFSKGFKGGGFPSAVLFAQGAQRPFEPEKLYDYELGFKASFLKNTFQLNGDVFYYDYKDWQANFTSPGQPDAQLQNAGTVHLEGIELEATWIPIEHLLIRNGLIRMENKIVQSNLLEQSYATGQLQSIVGNKIPNAPNLSFNALVQYDIPFTPDRDLALQADGKCLSSYYLETDDRAFLKDSPYCLLDARIGLSSNNKAWEVALAGQNLTNRLYWTSGYDLISVGSLGNAVRYPSRPRSWALEVTHHF